MLLGRYYRRVLGIAIYQYFNTLPRTDYIAALEDGFRDIQSVCLLRETIWKEQNKKKMF